MFKNMKKVFALALPIFALTLTSCNERVVTMSYDQARHFVSDTYDKRALDTVPATYTANFDRMMADIDVKYVTPQGGKDSFKISFGYRDIHVTVRDEYAVCLSSVLLDSIEKYYSDFVGLAVSIQEEPPIQMQYQLVDGKDTKINFTASQKIIGNVLVKVLQFLTSAIDSIGAISGYIPLEYTPSGSGEQQKTVTEYIASYIYGLAEMIAQNIEPLASSRDSIKMMIYTLIDFVDAAISETSKSHGDVFNAYAITDQYGFFNKFDFNFKSNFDIVGLAAYKVYNSSEPEMGEKPISTESPYQFTISGSFDFDFNVVVNVGK